MVLNTPPPTCTIKVEVVTLTRCFGKVAGALKLTGVLASPINKHVFAAVIRRRLLYFSFLPLSVPTNTEDGFTHQRTERCLLQSHH